MQRVIVSRNPPFVYLFVGGCWYCYDYTSQPLGEGAMGAVYLGFDCSNQDRVAVKRVKDEYAEIAQVRDCARREASLRFLHPNIVRMIGLCEYEYGHGPMFILSEYIAGITFDVHVRMRLSLLPADERIIRIVEHIRPVLSALQYLHNNGVVHKDIKPSNIMIDSRSCVKLMDLGVANSFRSEAGHMYGFIGTPQYAAPEQIADVGAEAVVDPRTDIYSFGVTLYELITGCNPFNGVTESETLHNQRNLELPKNDAIPPGLFAVIARATAKNPDDRYRSAMEMDAELERYLSGARGRKPDSPETLRIVGAALAVSLALVLLFAIIIQFIYRCN